MMKKKTQHEIEPIPVFSALSRQYFYPISEYQNGTYVSMTNRRINNPYTLTLDNCIPLLTITTNAYNEVEKLKADISPFVYSTTGMKAMWVCTVIGE